MAVQFRFGILFFVLLVIALLSAGCSEESSSAVTTPVPTTAPAVKYSAGDIIATTSSAGDSQLYVITGYDAVKNEYERAWIYRNADGSWGHFIDSTKERAPRSIVEKVYTVTVDHVTVSTIPVVTPTVPVATQTQAAGSGPVVTAISPTSGARDTLVGVTITGSNFLTGAVPKLTQPGSPAITGTGVSVTATRIDCSFLLKTEETGSYNVVVTNPDGQSGTLQRGFVVGDAAPIISSVSPYKMEVNDQGGLVITGQNFKDGVKVVLVKGSAEIPCVSPVSTSGTRITCDLDLNTVRYKAVTFGQWDVRVINIEGSQSGTWTNKFTIQNETVQDNDS